MVQITTNYTTYELAYYYADLARLPRLSDEECQQLTASITQTTRLKPQARNRLIEGHLSLATHVAIDRCPPFYYRSLPDILGEVALTLVNVTDRYDFQAGKDFTSYVVACTDTAIKQAIGNDRLIRIPSSTLWAAKQKGTVEQLYNLQPDSLDEWMEWYNTDEIEEPPTTPLLPTQEAPPRDPELRAQVQAWFSYLSPRAQQVLTLRYGLSDEDERCLTTSEVADELGLKRQAVQYAERDALKRIQAMMEGTATITEKNGQQRITGIYKGARHKPTLTPEHEMLFMQVATRLCKQGIKVSGRLLAKETGKNIHLAHTFVRLHRHELPLVTSAKHTDTRQERLAYVAQVYDELTAQGKPPSMKRLASAAHVRNELAAEFMHTRKGEHHATA
jgi:RNA polymerase sigma factor (sigma-70 family)